MPSVQIKDVPPEVHAELRRRAARAGKSLQEFLLAQLLEQVTRPPLDELLERAGRRTGGALGFADAVSAIRADRDRDPFDRS